MVRFADLAGSCVRLPAAHGLGGEALLPGRSDLRWQVQLAVSDLSGPDGDVAQCCGGVGGKLVEFPQSAVCDADSTRAFLVCQGQAYDEQMRPDEATVNEPARTGTALVHAAYHLFQITDPQGPVADDLDASRTGLVSADGGAIEVTTGIHTGDVHVTVEPHSHAPDPAQGWEEIAEISCHSPSGEVHVMSFMDDPADLPSLASQGPGWYRLRVHARGRDGAVDQTTVDDVVESYLIQSWPAAHQDALLLKATDVCGDQVRAQEAEDTIVIDHEDSLDTQTGRERDILRRAERGDYS